MGKWTIVQMWSNIFSTVLCFFDVEKSIDRLVIRYFDIIFVLFWPFFLGFWWSPVCQLSVRTRGTHSMNNMSPCFSGYSSLRLSAHFPHSEYPRPLAHDDKGPQCKPIAENRWKILLLIITINCFYFYAIDIVDNFEHFITTIDQINWFIAVFEELWWMLSFEL